MMGFAVWTKLGKFDMVSKEELEKISEEKMPKGPERTRCHRGPTVLRKEETGTKTLQGSTLINKGHLRQRRLQGLQSPYDELAAGRPRADRGVHAHQ